MNSGFFNESDLVKVYAPPNLFSVMPGNLVMLRSGGPKMIVDYQDDAGMAVCSWAVNGTRHTHLFDLKCLTCYCCSKCKVGVEE